MTDLLWSILWGLLTLCVVCFGLLPHFGGTYWQKVSGLSRLAVLRRQIERVLSRLLSNAPFVGDYFGGVSQQKLLFVPDADNEPEGDHEISEPALFRFLLNEETLEKLREAEAETQMLGILKDIDKNSKIVEFETHQSSMGSATTFKEAFHVFIVFKTTCKTDGDYWWSLEKNQDYIALQRCRNKENVKDQCYGEKRNEVKSIVENLVGKGTIKDLFEILWAHQIIPEKYNVLNSNCQSFVTFISQQITEIGYNYEGFFKYSPPPESGRDKKMLDLIVILRGRSNWPPLFDLIFMGNVDLVDKLIQSGKYDLNALYNGFTPLHFAIMFSKTKMVKYLLNPPTNADPTKGDASGKSALLLAAVFTKKAEIFDFLLAHDKVKVDNVDGKGHTALHWAAFVSNVIAVQKLIEKGANPNLFDKEGRSPLHVAAEEREGIPIIDLLLEAQKVKGIGNVNNRDERGETALHCAARASNEITAEHLIQKGADVHFRDKNGDTPLHFAALGAKDMSIIDLLLRNINEGDMSQYRKDKRLFLYAMRNVNGLEEEIGLRFLEVGIETPSTETDEGSQEIDAILTEEQFDINGRDQNGQTLLLDAIRANNVNAVRRLLEKGVDPTIRDENGETAFHLAAAFNKDTDILNLLLESEKVNINETTSQQGWTALHIAIVTSNLTAARFLLSKGARPNVADEDGHTPLHWAARIAKDVDMVELFLNHKDVDVNCSDNAGRNALDFARENKKGHGERIADRLKEKGAVESENKLLKGNNEFFKKHVRVFSNQKPGEIENFLSDDTIANKDKIDEISEKYLLSAVRDSNVESVRILLKNGAGISTRGEKGENTLHLASRYAKTTDLIDAILETDKFDIDGTDNEGNTPLHYAIIGTNCERNARHLIQKGADPTTANKTGFTPLHLAASFAKTIETTSLILANEKVDINHISKEGETALHYAIKAQNVEIARCLLEKGADPTIRDKDGYTSFHLAAHFLTDSDLLSLMLGNEKKIEIDERDKMGRTALHLAIATSNVTAAHFLLSKGANPNVADEDGLTPLHVAAMLAKDMDMVELLLNHKDVDVNGLDNSGKNALDIAKGNMYGHGERIAKLLKEKGAVSQTENSLNDEKVENEVTFENSVKIVLQEAFADSDVGATSFLIQMGADISTVKWGEGEWNALHMASNLAKTTEILDVILATGQFDINGCDLNGETALHHALRAKNMTTARYLLNGGADRNRSDKRGITPLHLAAFHSTTTDIIGLILKGFLVDIDSRDVNGWTPFHYAIGASNVTTARYLLEKGADPTIRDSNGNTSFHIAAENDKSSEILNLLLESGKVDVNETTPQQRLTALHLAIGKSNVTAARFLLSIGANPNVADVNGGTPLHMAALHANDMDMVELLLNHQDTNVDYLDNHGNNALVYAKLNEQGLSERIANRLIEKGAVGVEEEICQDDLLDERTRREANDEIKAALNEAIVESDVEKVHNLIEMGVDLSKTTWGGGMNALHAATVYAKKTKLLDIILATDKFDIDGRDGGGQTALHYAVKASNVITARYLLENGADPTTRENNGHTPFHLAVGSDTDFETINLLLNSGKVDINETTSQDKTTALHIATVTSNVTAARFLLSNGANPNVANQNGFTPLHFAALWAKDLDIVELLLNHEATYVDYLDNKGNNALHYAMCNEHGLGEAIANLLREKMAAMTEGSNHEPENIEALVPAGGIKEDSFLDRKWTRR